MKELRVLKKDGISAEELRRSKEHLKGNLMLSLESTSSRMNRLARHEMRFGSFLSMDAMLAAIDGVQIPTRSKRCIHRILDENQLSLLALGPIDRRHLPRDLSGRLSEALDDRALQPARDGAHLDPGRQVWRLAAGGAGGVRGLCPARA